MTDTDPRIKAAAKALFPVNFEHRYGEAARNEALEWAAVALAAADAVAGPSAKPDRERLTALVGEAWDDGNATGLDGWVGPGRGAGRPDREAQHRRTRMVLRADAILAEWPEPAEVEWEYGLMWYPYVTGDGAEPQAYSGCETEEGARAVGARLAASGQTARVFRRPVKPAIQPVPAGPWEEVSEWG